MIRVKVAYASALELPREELELITGSVVELKEKVVRKLGESALCFASAGNLILDASAVLADDQEIFVFPFMNGG